MFLAKQDLKSVPFHILHEKSVLAKEAVEYNLVALEKAHHVSLIARKEKEWADTHESPFEGNFEEFYPFNEPDPSVVAAAVRKAQLDAVKEQVEILGLKTKASWLLPQVTSYIAKMRLPEGEKIDPLEFLKINFAVDDWHKGLYLYCTVAQRGMIVPNQTTPEFKNYSALVPLLMMPFKKFNDVPYSRWSKLNLNLLVDPSLYEAMTCEQVINLDSTRILEIRNQGLLVNSGKAAGTSRNAVTYHNLYKIQDTEIGELPWLAQVMITQIWAAHPTNRTNLMILDWLNWDAVPTPLIDVTAGIPTPKNNAISSSALPW